MPQISFTGVYTPHDRKIFDAGDEERKNRHTLISLYWQYYEGNHRKFLKTTPGTYDDNTVINLCSQAVDRMSSFMFPTVPRLKYSTKKAQKQVDTIWVEQEYIPTLLTDCSISGLVGGHVYMRIDASNPQEPKYVNLDPRLVTSFWDITNPQETLWYRMTWADANADNPQYHGEIFYIEDYVRSIYDPNAVEDDGWQIITYRWDPNLQNNMIMTEVDREYWPYDFAPIVDWKAQPKPFAKYGPSLLKHLHVNDVANFLFSNTNRILRFHAHPKTIILGASKEELQQTAIDQVWAIPVTGAQVFNLEMQSELNASMMMFEQAKSSFFSQTHVVDTAAHKDKIGQITNFGLHVLFSDMLDHTDVVRQLYGVGIQELIYRSMYIMGNKTAGHPEIIWPDPLPVNRTELVNSVKVEQSIGSTSPQTLAETLDRDYESEQDRLKQAKKAGVLNLAEDGIHEIDDLPVQKAGAAPAGNSGEDTEEMDADGRLQRSIESI